MNLYCTTTSERGKTVNKSGNEHISTTLTVGEPVGNQNQGKVVAMMQITRRYGGYFLQVRIAGERVIERELDDKGELKRTAD